ncbi:hypothetical protein BDFB_003146 [Asbolus verrucosus]|nr:hypothetical protein BDFB_003146 [Asbolus verrucosus]
MCRRKSP